jgi:biopolymer transport protein ExbB/TolQ
MPAGCVHHLFDGVGNLALVGIVSPLLGLAGTLFGAILALIEVSRREVAPVQSHLAAGLAHPLIVVLHGVLLAVMATLVYTVFKNRLQRIAVTANAAVYGLLTQLHFGAR